MRIEILREDSDPVIQELWKALSPLNKTGKVFVYMSHDLGPQGDQRGMVICLEDFKETEIVLTSTTKSFNPSLRLKGKEVL